MASRPSILPFYLSSLIIGVGLLSMMIGAPKLDVFSMLSGLACVTTGIPSLIMSVFNYRAKLKLEIAKQVQEEIRRMVK